MTPETIIMDEQGLPTAQMLNEWRTKVIGLPTKRPMLASMVLVISTRCPSREFMGLCRKVLGQAPDPLTEMVDVAGKPTEEFLIWWNAA